MSAQSQFAANDSKLEASASRCTEEYGSDDLPVLIRLPNLLPTVSNAEPLSTDQHDADQYGAEPEEEPAESHLPHREADQDSELDERAVIPITVSDSVGSEPAATQDEQLASEGAPQQLRQQRQRRRLRANRRSERQIALPAWLRGIRQLAFAAVVAAILLAVIVTVKNWSASDGSRREPEHIVEAPVLDFGDPMPPPPGYAGVEEPLGPVLQPPTITEHESSLERAFPVDSAGPYQGQGDPVPYGDRSRTTDAGATVGGSLLPPARATQYPNTGARPVAAGPEPSPSGEAWQETLPVFRRAERSPTHSNVPQHR